MALNKDSIDDILERYLPANVLKEVNLILYGEQLDERYLGKEKSNNYDIEKYRFNGNGNIMRPRIVKVAAIQHSIDLPTNALIHDQRANIFSKMETITAKAASLGANITCFPETWNMPFGFCTRQKEPWCEYAEDCDTGPSTSFARRLAQQHHMVIISPILERDTNHGDVLWNTAVIISERGEIIGKQRKNHIPHNGESSYYMAGSTGCQVFDTIYGKIGVSICFDRHFASAWMMYGLNGAEIVFNTSATTVGEHWWPIEARSAAFSNSYYVVALNRVGVEKHFYETSDFGAKEKTVGPFYGSTYISAPDGRRTKCLSSNRDGILFAELDLSLCQQMKQQFGFDQSHRWTLYKHGCTAASKISFIPQTVPE